MLDKDLEALDRRTPIDRLDRLERDIWLRESALQAGRRATRQLASWQAFILLLAIAVSAATGMSAASSVNPRPTSFESANLAPATLLLGVSR